MELPRGQSHRDRAIGPTTCCEKQAAADISAARDEAISYAAYRVLSQRYTCAVDTASSQMLFDDVMADLGYDIGITTTVGNTPAAIGNRVAQTILQGNLNDGSNEANCHVDNTSYSAVNTPMVVDYASVTDPEGTALADPNRWQPLELERHEGGLVRLELGHVELE